MGCVSSKSTVENSLTEPLKLDDQNKEVLAPVHTPTAPSSPETPPRVSRTNVTSIDDPYLKGGAYLGDPKDDANFKYVTWTEYPNFSHEHHSAMSKHLTEDLFNQLKNTVSSKGYTLSNAIMTGVVNTHLKLGATAGDDDDL